MSGYYWLAPVLHTTSNHSSGARLSLKYNLLHFLNIFSHIFFIFCVPLKLAMDSGKALNNDGAASKVSRLQGSMLSTGTFSIVLVSNHHPVLSAGLDCTVYTDNMTAVRVRTEWICSTKKIHLVIFVKMRLAHKISLDCCRFVSESCLKNNNYKQKIAPSNQQMRPAINPNIVKGRLGRSKSAHSIIFDHNAIQLNSTTNYRHFMKVGCTEGKLV